MFRNIFASTLANRIVDILKSLRGGVNEFSLQARIYHSVCLATILVMLYVLLFSFLNGLFVAGLITLSITPLQIALFYLSRYRGKTTLSFNVYTTLMHVFFIFNYRINSGMSGPTLLSFLSVYFLTIAVSQKKYYLVWTALNFSVVTILLATEFYFPGFVTDTYQNKEQQSIDWISTYAVTMILLFASITYIIANYRKEREKVEFWAMELDHLHEEKSRLLEVISHDYQTPLITMRHYLEAIQHVEMENELRRSMEAELANTLTNTQNLLQNILEPARRRNSSGELAAILNVIDTLKPVLAVYKDIATTKGFTLTIDIPYNLQIVAHKTAFSVVIRNLLNNAIKFTQKSGWIHLTYTSENDREIFKLTNSGYIEDTDIQTRIRTYLNNEHNEIHTLGMSIIRQNTKIMNGVIEFQSTAESGTFFSLSIPKTNSLL